MIVAFVPRDNVVDRIEIAGDQPLPVSAIWFDLLNPTPDEKSRIQAALGLSLPTSEEMREIEPSSRLYIEGDASYMTATVLTRADEPNPSSVPISFILARRALVTLRYAEPRPIDNFAARLCRQPPPIGGCEEVLAGLIEAFVDRIADILEKVGIDLDSVSKQIFYDNTPAQARKEENDLKRVIRSLGRNDDLASTARESLLSLSRLIRFLGAILESNGRKTSKELKARLKIADRDIASLNEHVAFESHKTNFLLDATLGMINIEQNRIIKLFSVAAVVLMPPTLVASIYGMNFRHMPELDWTYGYPAALVIMILAAVLPYYFFKRKGWF